MIIKLIFFLKALKWVFSDCSYLKLPCDSEFENLISMKNALEVFLLPLQ